MTWVSNCDEGPIVSSLDGSFGSGWASLTSLLHAVFSDMQKKKFFPKGKSRYLLLTQYNRHKKLK